MKWSRSLPMILLLAFVMGCVLSFTVCAVVDLGNVYPLLTADEKSLTRDAAIGVVAFAALYVAAARRDG